MGDGTAVITLTADSWFLRRVSTRKHIKPDAVHWRVFKARQNEPSISYHLMVEDLATPQGIDRYQLHYQSRDTGDLPGICRLSYVNLAEDLDPPLPPRSTPDEDDDPLYRHLHCSTDPPPDEDTMRRLAKLATKNGILRPYIRAQR